LPVADSASAAVPSRPAESSFRAGLRAGTAIAPAVFVIAVSFGVLARDLGWGVVAPIVSSAIVFSGSAQFALSDVLEAGGTALAAIVAAILVNARFAVMGVAVASIFHGGRLRRAIEAQTTVDASWALANQGGGRFDRELLMGATLPQYVAWVGGTAAGVFAGDVVSDPETLGLDVVFPAFFLYLLIAEVRRGRDYAAAGLIAAAVALVLIPVTPPGIPIIAACAGALLGLRGRGA
jgi:4-azaleucine resistance transporter AzlC